MSSLACLLQCHLAVVNRYTCLLCLVLLACRSGSVDRITSWPALKKKKKNIDAHVCQGILQLTCTERVCNQGRAIPPKFSHLLSHAAWTCADLPPDLLTWQYNDSGLLCHRCFANKASWQRQVRFMLTTILCRLQGLACPAQSQLRDQYAFGYTGVSRPQHSSREEC